MDLKEILSIINSIANPEDGIKLKEFIQNLEDKIHNLREDNLKLQEQILKYKKEIDKAKDYKKTLEKYSFIKKYGIYSHRETGEYFCPACLLNKDNQIEAPLKAEESGWRCPYNSNHYFNNPDWRPPKTVYDTSPWIS